MTKAAILISAVLLFAGVATAGSLTSGRGSDTPSIETPTLSTPTGAVTQQNQQTTPDISGPCDEAEHASDPRCTGAAGGQALPGNGDDRRDNSGPGNADDSGHDADDNSGPGSSNSGPGGGDDDD